MARRARIPSSFQRPAGLIAITLGALVLCIHGSPWSPWQAGAAITLLSALPLGFLAYLTGRIWRTSRVLRGMLADDAAMLPDIGSEILARINISEAKAPPPIASDGPARSTTSLASRTLTDRTFDWIRQIAMARENLRINELRQFLSEQVLDLLDPLQRDHQRAFAAGLAGTVAGLGAQVYIAQVLAAGSVFNGTFFIGVVLKASCTFVGLLVAAYAQSVRWAAIDAYEGVIDHLCDVVARDVAPTLRRNDLTVVDLPSLLSGIVRALAQVLEPLASSLAGAIAEEIKKAQEALRTFLSDDLGPTLRREVTDPLCADIAGFTAGLVSLQDTIEGGTRAMAKAADDLSTEVIEALRASEEGTRALEVVCGSLRALGSEFDIIARHANEAAAEFRRSSGEMQQTLTSVQQGDVFDLLERLVGELNRCAQHLREGQQKSSEVLSRAVMMLDLGNKARKALIDVPPI